MGNMQGHCANLSELCGTIASITATTKSLHQRMTAVATAFSGLSTDFYGKFLKRYNSCVDSLRTLWASSTSSGFTRRCLRSMPSACSGGFPCISLLHTHAHTRSCWFASPIQGNAWMTCYRMVWYGVLAPNHPMCLVESRLPQNCMMGFLHISFKSVSSPWQSDGTKKVGTTRPSFKQKRCFAKALGSSACSGGFGWISLLHTRARAPSPPLASPRQGRAWLTWYGIAWYGVLAPNHPMRLAESRLIRNCMMGVSHIFPQKCVFSTAMQWYKSKSAPPGAISSKRGVF